MTLARRLLGAGLATLGLATVLAVATLPLGWREQAVFGCGAIAAFLLIDRVRGRAASLLLLALSAAVSLRYLFWRLAGTLDAPAWPASAFSLMLLAVEVGALVALWRIHAPSAWPLRRPPWPLPADPQAWPAIDVFVTTEVEPLDTVRTCVLAATGMDWPPERLTVWLLDAGGRAACRTFAEEAGCRYLAPAESRQGRAGLLNLALTASDAEFVALLDAADAPTRALLQLTLGWLLARRNLGFVQSAVTTQAAGRALQDGADTFGTTPFRGSGAVLRRAALRHAGGFAASDTGTARRLRRRGWRGAFLGVPLAGGGDMPRRRSWMGGATGPLLAVMAAAPVALLSLSVGKLALAAYAVPHVLLALASVVRIGARARVAARSEAALPVSLAAAEGISLVGHAAALRRDGATLRLDGAPAPGAMVNVGVRLDGELVDLPARVVGAHAGETEIAWAAATLAEEARVVRVVYGRADAWSGRLVAAAVLGAALWATPPALAQASTNGSDYSVRPIPGAPAETLPPVDAGTPGSRTVVYTLHQLGAPGPLALRGTQPVLPVTFGVRADEVVTAATLNLEGAVSPALIPALSNVTVTLNGQYVATIPADSHTPGFTAEVPITASQLQNANRLEFRLAGRAQADCDDPLSPLLWATIADSSTLTLTLARLPPQRDLARLPKPFFDAGAPGALVLPFVLPPSPDSQALRAAGIAASWFGQLAGARGASFPVATAPPASGDAVVVQGDADGAGLPGAPPIDGPTLAVLANPHDPFGSLLLIAGRSDAEAVVAARALAFGIRALAGTQVTVQPPEVAARRPYDAPAWVATDRPVRLGALAGDAALQGSGYTSLLTVPFRIAPDLWTWRDRPFTLDLRWRAPPGSVTDLAASRFDVGMDGDYLASLPLAAADAPSTQGRVAVPPYDVSGNGSLNLFFDARPLRRGACAAIPEDLRMAVDADSTLDFSRAHHITRLPNLGFFAATGFPFTRLADLSQTAVVLPEQPSAVEIGAFLDMMGGLGEAAGLPGGEVAVVRPGEVAGVADRDLLVLGTLAGLQSPGLAGLLDNSPVGFADGRLHVKLGQGLPAAAARARAAVAMSAEFAGGLAVLTAAESPLQAGRSVVALVASDSAALDAAMASLRDPAQVGLIQGDLVLLSGGQVSAYRVGPSYTVGSLPFWLWPSWYLADQPLPALGLLLGGCALLAVAAFWWLRSRAAARLQPPPLA